jgi:hypothetical protein
MPEMESAMRIAVFYGSNAMVRALLSLPLSVGLEVSAKETNFGTITTSLGQMNERYAMSLDVFEQLLRRTDRRAINDGLILVGSGRGQAFRADVHVLISTVFACTFTDNTASEQGLQRATLFIAHARADGSGTDLTGGIARSNHDTEPAAYEIWPNSQYRGPLAFVDMLHCWWSSQCGLKDPYDERRLARLACVRHDLVTALDRIRSYRIKIEPAVAECLGAGAIHTRHLSVCISTYLLVPLHDESRLRSTISPPVFFPSLTSSV